jgi:flagellar biosynthesis/type III secretory pathway chaperone
MFNPEINTENVITISKEDLKEEQKQVMEKAIEDYRQLFLELIQLEQERRSHPEARSVIASVGYL